MARTEFIPSALWQGATTTQVRCAGNAVVQGYTEVELADPTGAAFQGPAGQARLHRTMGPAAATLDR